MTEKITNSPEETIEYAKSIGKLLKDGDVIAYRGGLGAGKTTFTRGLSIGFGTGDNVTSPTFVIQNEYSKDEKHLYHFDMYRISDSGDLETTGFFDCIDGYGVTVVEWSENIEDELPKNTIFITLERIDDETRKITIDGDERFC